MNIAAWVAIPFAYLLGTFPSATLIARASGIDITKVGSGNPGASNISRNLGWRKGVWVFVLDAAKGAICAGAGLLIAGRPAGYALAGAAIIGHSGRCAEGWDRSCPERRGHGRRARPVAD